MRYSIALALASAAVVSAVNMTVLVGDQNALTFTPSSVTAQAGDTINFEFHSKNHSVTQSTFASPCQFMTTPKQGIDSGFQATAAGATTFASWSFTVDDASTPLWFYCAQTVPANHCQAGMVFAVNPTADKSFDAFQAAAKSGNAASNSTTPGGSAAVPGSTPLPSYGATGGAIPSASSTPSGLSTSFGSPPAVSTGSSTGSSAPANSTDAAGSNSGALRMGGNTAALLAVVGLVAGLML